MCNKIIFWANRRCADRRSWVYVCQKQVRAESSSNQSVRVGGEAKVFTGPAGMSTEAKTATGHKRPNSAAVEKKRLSMLSTNSQNLLSARERAKGRGQTWASRVYELMKRSCFSNSLRMPETQKSNKHAVQ